MNVAPFNLRLVALALLGVLPLLGGLNRAAVICTGSDGQTHLDVAHVSGECVEHAAEDEQRPACTGGHDHSHPHPAPEDQAPAPCDDAAIDFDLTTLAAQDELDLAGFDLPIFSFEWVAPFALDANVQLTIVGTRILGPPGPEPVLRKTARILI